MKDCVFFVFIWACVFVLLMWGATFIVDLSLDIIDAVLLEVSERFFK